MEPIVILAAAVMVLILSCAWLVSELPRRIVKELGELQSRRDQKTGDMVRQMTEAIIAGQLIASQIGSQSYNDTMKILNERSSEAYTAAIKAALNSQADAARTLETVGDDARAALKEIDAFEDPAREKLVGLAHKIWYEVVNREELFMARTKVNEMKNESRGT